MESVDFSVLDEFKELMGDEGEEEVRDLVNLYLEDGPVQLGEMKSSLASGDAETFKRAAHSFKSSCGNIGAQQLQTICQELETKTSDGTIDDSCSESLILAEDAFSEVKVALAGYLAP